MKKIILLGSGELGKEFVIAAKRLGQFVVAVDSYDNAPAQQVADEREVIDMLDGGELNRLIEKKKPDIVIPEIEAIRTERFYEYEKYMKVVPSAKAANYTMNRKKIRELARENSIPTPDYDFASSLSEFKTKVQKVGIPCIVKPIMSSSGKGQAMIKNEDEIEDAWKTASEEGRSKEQEVIVEEFIEFDYEITLLTLTQDRNPTLFCNPIGHRQQDGDYRESWQPVHMNELVFEKAKLVADKMTNLLGGSGIWGVEFFVKGDYVYFSELSPRPHDTGMVTLCTQNFSEFELHARAVLGIPVPEIIQEKAGASSVILSPDVVKEPSYKGFRKAGKIKNSDFRIFGKPITKPKRRMGVTLAWGDTEEDINRLRAKAKEVADCIRVF